MITASEKVMQETEKQTKENEAEKEFDIENGYTQYKAQSVLTDFLNIMLSVGIGVLIVIINMLIR